MSGKSIFSRISVLMIFMALLAGVMLSSGEVKADVVDDVVITVPAVCTLASQTGTGETYTVSMNPNQYKNDIGDTTLSVYCNDTDGFSIYAIGFSNNEYGNNKMITSTVDRYIATGTATSGGTSNWAMKLTAVTSSGTGVYTPTIVSPFSNFTSVPASYAKAVTVNPATDSGTSAQVKATYAVYTSATQVADTYTGKVKYTIVHPASEVPNQPYDTAAGKIGYYPNASGVTNTMDDQSASANASVTLWASNFKRPGYGFAGWSDAFDYVANVGSESNPNAHIYGPNETITTPSDLATKGLSLYAVWVKSAGNLQGFTCPDNTTMPIGKVTALTDTRDNDTYAVAKLADGNCWMIENLRLDYDADFTESLSQGFGKSTTYGNFIGLADPEVANFSNSTTANSIYYSGTQSGTASININTTDYPGYRFPRYRNDNTNTDTTKNPNTTEADMTGIGQNIYSYGNYYTWAAAMANTIHYSGPTAQDADGKTSETVKTSICPAGWKLPYERNTGNGALSGGFSYLDIQLGGTGATQSTSAASLRWRTYPNNFLYSGRAGDSSVRNRGSYGYYWSSTALNNGNSYYLYLYSSNVNPGTSGSDKFNGLSVRCVAGV